MIKYLPDEVLSELTITRVGLIVCNQCKLDNHVINPTLKVLYVPSKLVFSHLICLIVLNQHKLDNDVSTQWLLIIRHSHNSKDEHGNKQDLYIS